MACNDDTAMNKKQGKTPYSGTLQAYHIRPLGTMEDSQAEDTCDGETVLRSIEAIEQCFPSPWSKTQIESELTQPNTIVMGAFQTTERQEKLLGWSCVRFIAPEAELFKIAVLPQWQQRGIATTLMNRIIGQCRQQFCSTLFLEVREHNLPAIALYKAVGFRQIALRKSYYSSPTDNAVIMRKEIDQISHH